MKCFLLFLEDAAARGHLRQVIGGTLDGRTFDHLVQGRLHAAQIIREGHWGRGERWHPTDFVTAVPHLAQERHERPRVTERYGRHGLECLVEAMDPPADQPPEEEPTHA